jgi:hypothetical protein
VTKARVNADNVTADISGITAGTGITGGGTSGTVTVTNSMATAIDAAGDLIYGTGADTFTRLAVGSTGNLLTVAGGVPTWAAPAASGFNGARVYQANNHSYAPNTTTALTFDAEDYDTNTYHSNSTNPSRLTVPSTGYYRISCVYMFAYVNQTNGVRYLYLFKNGTDIQSYEMPTTNLTYSVDIPVMMGFTTTFNATANDYFELFGRHNWESNLNNSGTGSTRSYFEIQYLGA